MIDVWKCGCGAENPITKRYCTRCGAEISQSCIDRITAEELAHAKLLFQQDRKEKTQKRITLLEGGMRKADRYKISYSVCAVIMAVFIGTNYYGYSVRGKNYGNILSAGIENVTDGISIKINGTELSAKFVERLGNTIVSFEKTGTRIYPVADSLKTIGVKDLALDKAGRKLKDKAKKIADHNEMLLHKIGQWKISFQRFGAHLEKKAAKLAKIGEQIIGRKR